MKTILVPFHSEEVCTLALHGAALLGRRFGSYVEGLLVSEGPHLEIGHGVPMPAEPSLTTPGGGVPLPTAHARASVFRRARTVWRWANWRPRIRRRSPAGGNWRETKVTSWERGQLFDLIVIGRPEEPTARWQNTCEAALFETGRPVMVIGAGPAPSIGHVIAIYWNGWTKSARTIALAMPLLMAAAKVEVVTVEGGMIGGPEGREVARHLERNGIAARARKVEPKHQSTGEAFIAEAKTLGADLLLKGAYTRSRLRQYIFGGATEHILRHSPIPVLMAH